jgi:hypothetical protein
VPAFAGERRIDELRLTFVNADPFGLPAHLSIEESFGFRSAIEETPGGWPTFKARLRRGAEEFDQLGIAIEIEEGTLGADARVVMVVDLPSLATDVPGNTNGVGRALEVTAPFPNPFHERVAVGFSLPAPARVGGRILDAQGRCVRDIAERDHVPGAWRFEWDGRQQDGVPAPAGVYFYQLTRDGRPAAEGRMIRVR